MKSITLLSILFTMLTFHPVEATQLEEEGTVEHVFENPEGGMLSTTLIISVPNSQKYLYSSYEIAPLDEKMNVGDQVNLTYSTRGDRPIIYSVADIDNLSNSSQERGYRFEGWISPETHNIQSIHSSDTSFTPMTIIQLEDGREFQILRDENNQENWQAGDQVALLAISPFPLSDEGTIIKIINLSGNHTSNSLKIWPNFWNPPY